MGKKVPKPIDRHTYTCTHMHTHTGGEQREGRRRGKVKEEKDRREEKKGELLMEKIN